MCKTCMHMWLPGFDVHYSSTVMLGAVVQSGKWKSVKVTILVYIVVMSFGRGKLWSRTTGPFTLADILCRKEEQLSGLLLTLESLVCPSQKEYLLSLRVSPFHPKRYCLPK